MSFIGNYSEEKENLVPPPPEKPQGPTLASVLQDPKESALFGSMLKAEGADSALMLRLADSKLEPGDMRELEVYRAQFFEKKERVKTVNAVVTKETIVDFAASHPELQQIINMVGPDKAVGILQAQMARLAVEEPPRFDEIFNKVRILGEARKRAEELDKIVEERVQKLGLDTTTVAKILAIDNTAERKKKLSELVKEKYKAAGEMASWKNLWRGKKDVDIEREVVGLDMNKMYIETRLSEIDHHMERVGEVLALDMENNADLRHALAREITGEKKVEEKNSGFKEMKSSLMSDETLMSEWAEFKAAEADWATKSDADKTAARDRFVQEYQKKREDTIKKGKGFWSSIFSGMFSLYTIDSAKKDKLKL